MQLLVDETGSVERNRVKHGVSSIEPGHGRPITEGRFFQRGYEARIANDSETRRDAYRLRYLSYSSRGYIAPNVSGLFSDEYDDLPTTITVVVYAEGLPVGSMRICLLRRDPLIMSPARLAYGRDVEAILEASDPDDRGLNCFEVNRLVRSPQSADDQGLVFLMLRLAGRIGADADFQVAINCVRANHLPFYRRMNFVEAGPMRMYPGLNCQMTLMQLSHERWKTACKVFRLIDPESGLPGMLNSLENVWSGRVEPLRLVE